MVGAPETGRRTVDAYVADVESAVGTVLHTLASKEDGVLFAAETVVGGVAASETVLVAGPALAVHAEVLAADLVAKRHFSRL